MNKISCDMCRDLFPLVKDGIASEDSRKAVEEHLAECADCREMLDTIPDSSVDSQKIFRRIRKKIQFSVMVIMMLGIFFGISMTAGAGVFYNTIIMPVIGVLGYMVYGTRAFFHVPILLFIVHLLTNFMGTFRGAEHLDFMSLIFWTGLYVIFALLGVLTAWLLHFALGKEKEDENEKK